MALTQMQLIQSLGDALGWLEREIGWGVSPTELRHLCGRIGELYAAMITNGQMAPEVNQAGYDVVSSEGDRISVKTTARSEFNGPINFNPASLHHVDRVMILRINIEEMQVEKLLDSSVAQAREMMTEDSNGGLYIPLGRLAIKTRPEVPPTTVGEQAFEGYVVRELETGSISVEKGGVAVEPAKPALREIAAKLNIGLLNGNGNPLNTRQLGTRILKSLAEFQAS